MAASPHWSHPPRRPALFVPALMRWPWLVRGEVPGLGAWGLGLGAWGLGLGAWGLGLGAWGLGERSPLPVVGAESCARPAEVVCNLLDGMCYVISIRTARTGLHRQRAHRRSVRRARRRDRDEQPGRRSAGDDPRCRRPRRHDYRNRRSVMVVPPGGSRRLHVRFASTAITPPRRP